MSSRPFATASHALLHHGHSPLPQLVKEQAPFQKGWTDFASRQLPAGDVERYANSPLPYNVGIALGFSGVVALDRDTDDPAIKAALQPAVTAIYNRGGVPVAKFGSKGLTSFYRWADAAPWINRSFKTPPRPGNPRGEVFLELSGAGRSTTLPPSRHPKTGRPYEWRTARTLLDARPEQLPVITGADVRAIEGALAPFVPAPREVSPIRPTVQAAYLDERSRQRHAALARHILGEDCQKLAAMPPNSGRNHETFRLVCRLGKWVKAGILPVNDLISAIVAACTANGFVSESGRHAVLATIKSGLAKSERDELPELGARP